MKRYFISILILVVFAVGCKRVDSKVTRTNKKVKGIKKRIAVMKFEDNSSNNWYKYDVGEGISDMLTTAAFKSGEFIVVERELIDKILEEQKFGEMGLTFSNSAAEIGKILGVDAIITGSVTEFGLSNKTNKVGGNTVRRFTDGLIKNISINKYRASVAIDVQMIDTTSAEVIFADTTTSKKTDSHLNFSSSKAPSFKIGAESFDNSIIGEVTREAVNKMVFKISENLASKPWNGYIIKATDENIFISGGNDIGIENGDVLEVKMPGEEVEDAEGNTFLIPGKKLGEIEVVNVMEKISKVKALEEFDIKKDYEVYLID